MIVSVPTCTGTTRDLPFVSDRFRYRRSGKAPRTAYRVTATEPVPRKRDEGTASD